MRGKTLCHSRRTLARKGQERTAGKSTTLTKIEAELCLLTTSCAASCFALTSKRDSRKPGNRKSDFRKDLDMTEQIGDALKRINKITEEMQKEMQKRVG